MDKRRRREGKDTSEVKQREAIEQGVDIPLLELPTDEELLSLDVTRQIVISPEPEVPSEGAPLGQICEHCSSSNQSDRPWQRRQSRLALGKLRNRDFPKGPPLGQLCHQHIDHLGACMSSCRKRVFLFLLYSLYISRRTRLFDFVVTPSIRRITVYMTVVVRQLSDIHHPRDENKM